jgi:uncharacterized membrane protein YfcA
MSLSIDIVVLIGVLLAAGFASGIIAGMLGVGGGIVLVPVLFQTFMFLGLPEHLQIHMAVATSLAIICFTGAQSARSHLARQAVDVDILKSWFFFVILGALCGAIAARFIAPVGLKLVFAGLTLFMGLRMLLSRDGGQGSPHELGLGLQKTGATLIGFFSALMGIGGGTLSVPLLGMSGRDVHKAVGTSSALGVVIAVPATLGFIVAGWHIRDLPDYSLGYVNALALGVIIPTSMLGAPLGARLAHSLAKPTLTYIFAGFLLLSSSRMIASLWL